MIECARAQALFVSHLQPCDLPTVEQVRATIRRVIAEQGVRGCQALVAQEFGEHPDNAVVRMLWAREAARRAYDPVPSPRLAAA